MGEGCRECEYYEGGRGERERERGAEGEDGSGDVVRGEGERGAK